MAIINIPPKQDDPQRLIMLNGVPQKFWLSAEEINTIIKYLAALLGAETSLYKGEYDYLEELEAAHPLPEPGSEAQIKVVDGDNLKASWDNTNKKWFLDGTWIPPGTDAAYLLKSIYDPDGDGSVLKADAATNVLAVLNATGTQYYGTRNGVPGVYDFPTQSGGSPATEQTKIFSVQRIPIGGLKEKIIFDYMFNGVYFQGTTEVTHPAADTVLPRIDGFSLTDEGTAIINPGTPSENPGNPSVEDPLTQIATSLFVLIPANATEPEGISIVTIFDESGSSGSGEWDLVENSNGRINLLSESDPSSGSFCIEGTALRKNDSFHATPPAPIAITGGQSITLEYKPKALNQAMLNILAYYTGADGNTYTEWLPRLGFNAGSLARQFISAKLSQAYTHLQQLGFINPNGNNVSYGFFIDEIKLIGGAGSTAPGDYATKAELNALKGRVTTLEENPGGGSSSIRRYLTIAAMLADQGSQPDKSVCLALDASADPTVDAGYAYYEYLGTTNGTLADYRKLSEEESMDVDPGETATSIKTKYESNPDTNAFTDALRDKLNSITGIFTTGLKTAYDAAANWVGTNGANVLAHLTKWATPATAGKIPQTKADGSIEWIDTPTGGGGGSPAGFIPETYYLKKTGNDATAVVGDPSKPFLTINAIFDITREVTQRVNVIVLDGGHYDWTNTMGYTNKTSIKSDYDCTIDFSLNNNQYIVPVSSTSSKSLSFFLPNGTVKNDRGGSAGVTFRMIGAGLGLEDCYLNVKNFYWNCSVSPYTYLNAAVSIYLNVQKLSLSTTLNLSSKIAQVNVETLEILTTSVLTPFKDVKGTVSLINVTGVGSLNLGNGSGGIWNVGNITLDPTKELQIGFYASSTPTTINFNNSLINASRILLGQQTVGNITLTGIVQEASTARFDSSNMYNGSLTFFNFNCDFKTGRAQVWKDINFKIINSRIKSAGRPISVYVGTAANVTVEAYNSIFEMTTPALLIDGGAPSNIATFKYANILTNATELGNENIILENNLTTY